MLVSTNVNPVAKIKVVGVGGAGGNSINTMISEYNIQGVEFMAFNTDQQALKNSLAPVTLQLGEELTQGLGAGGNHNLGAQSAEESLDQIHEHLAGAHMVFITAGMGGGTGTGAAAVVAGVAKNMGALTIAVVTKPFAFEGKHRMDVAEEGIAALRDKVDTLIVVPNQKLLEIVQENISFFEAMKRVDNVLAEGVQGISTLVTGTGFINVDFADVKSIMLNAGTALMGIGKASGDDRAEKAAREATTNPLLELSIEGATGVLYNITGGLNLTMQEVDKAAELIKEAVDPSANVIFGVTIDEAAGDEMSITIVATGFDEAKQVFSKPKAVSISSVSQSSNNGKTKTEPKDEMSSLLASDDDYSVPSDDNSESNDIDDVPAFMRKLRS
ncbi:cell division protein FtsZ [Candidatus Dojkabacteria bacterium]|nr:cell division protein FtsZ [Candidatus Dojkabacteria bacterium]